MGRLTAATLTLLATISLAATVTVPAHAQTATAADTPAPQPNRPAPPKGAPSDFFGLVSEDAFGSPGAYRNAQLATEASLGFRLIRQTFDWSSIEVAPGQYNFSVYDAFVGDAARNGITVLPIIFRAPGFRGGSASGTATYPPRKYSDLGDFGAVLVKRYGPDGTFWSQNPDVPKLPIRAWQIWNEPNLKAYWKKPNPKEYAKLLKAAAKPIKAADPSADIVTAGMPESRIGVPLKQFIPGLYKAGAARSFDVLAINPYGRTASAVIKNIKNVRTIMRKFHDSAPIWATEVGWSDSGPSSPQRAGAQGQAKQVGKLISLAVKNRRKLKLRGIVYFGWRDAAPYQGGKDFWGLHTGLLTLDGSPKPAFFAMQKALTAVGG